MADRSSARVLAPLALIAAAAGIASIVVVSRTGTSAPARTRPAVAHHGRHRTARPRSYVVRAGDTLTLIAGRTHVTLDVLQQLNPDVDPQALHPGERLKLTR